MTTLTTSAPAGRVCITAGTLRWQKAAEARRHVSVPAAPAIEATPAWAWELYHGRAMDLHRVASRLGVSRSDALALVAAYKPIADARAARRMAMAGEPTIDQVDPRARESFVALGTMLGIQDPRSRTWEGVGQRMANRLGASHYVDGMDLWMWHPAASTEAEQRGSAVGIRILPGGDYNVLDGWERTIRRLSTLKAAEAMAGRLVGVYTPTDA